MQSSRTSLLTTRRLILAGGLVSLLAVPTASGQETASSATVLPQGLAGEFRAGGTNRRPAVLVLGGSEGGLATAAAGARLFAEQGYSALGLGYFKAPGLPDTAENIPLEYFLRAIDWLGKQPSVDGERIGVIGGSKGAEAALLIASLDSRLKAVVACGPSSVAWAGVRPMSTQPSWTLGGAPIPFVPYDTSAPFKGIRDLYDRSYAKAAPEAAIAVEKINGPVLLTSGGQDEFWPATPMSEAIMARLAKFNVPHQRLHLNYPEAGHAVFGPPSAANPNRPPMVGVAAATQAAKADSWPKVLEFFKEVLRA